MEEFLTLVEKSFSKDALQVVQLNIYHYVFAMSLSVTFAFLIRSVYRNAFRGAMYDDSLSSALSVVLVVTTCVTIAISVQPALSIGMVGALSIVRFRTAVKDAMDISYMFWAISTGIILGAGMFPLAFILFGVVAVIMFMLKGSRRGQISYLLVVTCPPETEEKNIISIFAFRRIRYKIKSQTVEEHKKEISYEVEIRSEPSALIKEIKAIRGMGNVVLLSYDGDYIA